MIILAVVIILFLILSIVLLMGKGAFLIAGYNTMAALEKEKYDEVALCRAMGVMMLGITGCLLLIIPSIKTNNQSFGIVATILMIVIIIAGLIYMNTSKKIKRS